MMELEVNPHIGNDLAVPPAHALILGCANRGILSLYSAAPSDLIYKALPSNFESARRENGGGARDATR